jgi:hypothetical protein
MATGSGDKGLATAVGDRVNADKMGISCSCYAYGFPSLRARHSCRVRIARVRFLESPRRNTLRYSALRAGRDWSRRVIVHCLIITQIDALLAGYPQPKIALHKWRDDVMEDRLPFRRAKEGFLRTIHRRNRDLH